MKKALLTVVITAVLALVFGLAFVAIPKLPELLQFWKYGLVIGVTSVTTMIVYSLVEKFGRKSNDDEED